MLRRTVGKITRTSRKLQAENQSDRTTDSISKTSKDKNSMRALNDSDNAQTKPFIYCLIIFQSNDRRQK